MARVLAIVLGLIAALMVTVFVIKTFEINPGCQLYGADRDKWREGTLSRT